MKVSLINSKAKTINPSSVVMSESAEVFWILEHSKYKDLDISKSDISITGENIEGCDVSSFHSNKHRTKFGISSCSSPTGEIYRITLTGLKTLLQFSGHNLLRRLIRQMNFQGI